jgi:hypothetical protein
MIASRTELSAIGQHKFSAHRGVHPLPKKLRCARQSSNSLTYQFLSENACVGMLRRAHRKAEKNRSSEATNGTVIGSRSSVSIRLLPVALRQSAPNSKVE